MSADPDVTISKVVGAQSKYFQPLGAKTPYMVAKSDASTILQLGEISFLEDEMLLKVRKPYTITKQREKWTESEHQRFLEALKLYGRGWRQIEEHIGTKNAIQIRSHAQKFFSKLEKEQAIGGNLTDTAQDIDIPPPRPKRKPNHPYPRKAQATISAATTQNYSPSASAMFPSRGSTLCVAAGSYFQTALSTPLKASSARKESDQMHPGGIRSSLLCNSVGLKIFGQTFAPEIHSSTKSEVTMPNSSHAYASEMPAKACGTAVQEAFSLCQSINDLQSAQDFDTRSVPQNSSIESDCASDADQLQVSDVEASNMNNKKESSCITKEQKKSKERLQYQKIASKTGVDIVACEHKVKADHLRASNAVFSTCSDGSNLECEANAENVPMVHEMSKHQHIDPWNTSSTLDSLMMHRLHTITPIDATSFAATFTNISGLLEHPVFCRVPNLAYVPGPVTLARSLDPFLQHVMHGTRKHDSAAFTSSLLGTPKVDSAQMPARNCSSEMAADQVDVADAATVATLAAASAWWALQEPLTISNLNDWWFSSNAGHPAAIHSAATAELATAFFILDGSKEAMVQEFPAIAGRDIAIYQMQDPKVNLQKTSMSRGGEICDLISKTDHAISDQYIRKAVSRSCSSSDCDENKGVGGNIGKDYSYDSGHLRKQSSLFTSHEEQGFDEHKNSLITSKEQRFSEIGNAKHSCREFTGDFLSVLEPHHSCIDKYQQCCNSESQQCESRIASKNLAAYVQLNGKDEGGKNSKDTAFSFMDSVAQADSSTRMDTEAGLPCADYGSHWKTPRLVIEREEENLKACQEARRRAASSPDSVLNFDEVSHKGTICALNSLVGSSSPSHKRKHSSGVGFRPYQPPSRRNSVALSSSSNE